jgi:hypothetical protein
MGTENGGSDTRVNGFSSSQIRNFAILKFLGDRSHDRSDLQCSAQALTNSAGEALGGSAGAACNAATRFSQFVCNAASSSAFPPYLCSMNCADCHRTPFSGSAKSSALGTNPCLQEIFRSQNCSAVAQTLLATGRAQDDPRLLRFRNGFCLQSDRSATNASRAGDRKLTRLNTRRGDGAKFAVFEEIGDRPARARGDDDRGGLGQLIFC